MAWVQAQRNPAMVSSEMQRGWRWSVGALTHNTVPALVSFIQVNDRVAVGVGRIRPREAGVALADQRLLNEHLRLASQCLARKRFTILLPSGPMGTTEP